MCCCKLPELTGRKKQFWKWFVSGTRFRWTTQVKFVFRILNTDPKEHRKCWPLKCKYIKACFSTFVFHIRYAGAVAASELQLCLTHDSMSFRLSWQSFHRVFAPLRTSWFCIYVGKAYFFIHTYNIQRSWGMIYEYLAWTGWHLSHSTSPQILIHHSRASVGCFRPASVWLGTWPVLIICSICSRVSWISWNGVFLFPQEWDPESWNGQNGAGMVKMSFPNWKNFSRHGLEGY